MDIRSRFESSRFLHGDLHSGNILVDKNGHVWVIDPAGLQVGEKSVGSVMEDSRHFERHLENIDNIIDMQN